MSALKLGESIHESTRKELSFEQSLDRKILSPEEKFVQKLRVEVCN